MTGKYKQYVKNNLKGLCESIKHCTHDRRTWDENLINLEIILMNDTGLIEVPYAMLRSVISEEAINWIAEQ